MTSEMTSYERLVALIKERHGGTISDQEAHRMARNLMGYCELVIRVEAKRTKEVLDNQLQCSNLFMGWLYSDVEFKNSLNSATAREMRP